VDGGRRMEVGLLRIGLLGELRSNLSDSGLATVDVRYSLEGCATLSRSTSSRRAETFVLLVMSADERGPELA